MVYLTALKLQAPAYYLKRRRAIIGNLNRLFKQKEKNFYIQKYNVILFVGGDFVTDHAAEEWLSQLSMLLFGGRAMGRRHYIANIRDPSQCPLHSDNCFKRPRLHFLGYGLYHIPACCNDNFLL